MTLREQIYLTLAKTGEYVNENIDSDEIQELGFGLDFEVHTAKTLSIEINMDESNIEMYMSILDVDDYEEGIEDMESIYGDIVKKEDFDCEFITDLFRLQEMR